MKRRIGMILGLAVAMSGIAAPVPAAAQSASPAAPGEPLDVAIVMLLGQGDFYELWQAGAQSEADRLGANTTVYNAQSDSARQAADLEAATNSDPDAILISHGFPETLNPGIAAALDKGIPVVTNAVTPEDPRAVQMWIQDEVMAQQVIDVLVQDTGGAGDVIYVYVPGYAPLDRRNVVWEQTKAANPGIREVATIGVVDNNTVAGVADQAKAALQANPETVAIFAPYDEFAKGATLAVQELGMEDQVKVYGGDISTADIAVMTAEGSPWVATSSVDPFNFGAVAFRTAYTLANGGSIEDKVFVPPSLITQEGLRENGITNMEGLREAFPELVTPDIVPVE